MKNFSLRNLAGGFLGGMTGILLSWYIDPLALPFGVLLGVVIGWWYDQLWGFVTDALASARSGAESFMTFAGDAITTLGRWCGLPRRLVGLIRWLVVSAFIGTIVFIATAPGHTYRWYTGHPMNRGNAISFGTCFLWGLVMPIAAVVLDGYVYGMGSKQAGTEGLPLLIGLFGVILCMVGTCVYTWDDSNNMSSTMRRYYREWEVMSRYGSFGLFFYVLAAAIRYTFGMTLFLGIVVPWVFGTFAFFLISFLPVAFIFGIGRSLYLLTTTQTGHWPCFVVTLVVTGFSWLLYHNAFDNPVVLWMVALGTGTASGLATELLTWLLSRYFAGSWLSKWFARSMSDAMWGGEGIPAEYGVAAGGYAHGLEVIGSIWVTNSRFARLFRSICFDTPVARPVRIV